MQLGGYQKLTLIDYPGKLAATVFTQGCNFRCPFCHNPELVIPLKSHNPKAKPLEILEREFFQLLKKRKGKLEGVCITGGEPTIQKDLADFIRKIKELGYLVKLDTNGSRPEVLKELLAAEIIDYVAMDIKNTPRKYRKTSGGKADWKKIKKSVELIKKSGIDHEFRTTVVPGFHTENDIIHLADWLGKAEKYYLQEFRSEKVLDPEIGKIYKNQKIDPESIKKNLKLKNKKVLTRG